MFIDLHKALERLEEHLPGDRKITFEMLEKAYAHWYIALPCF